SAKENRQSTVNENPAQCATFAHRSPISPPVPLNHDEIVRHVPYRPKLLAWIISKFFGTNNEKAQAISQWERNPRARITAGAPAVTIGGQPIASEYRFPVHQMLPRGAGLSTAAREAFV